MIPTTRKALEMAQAATNKFIAKVEAGKARSVETYNELKAVSAAITEALAEPAPRRLTGDERVRMMYDWKLSHAAMDAIEARIFGGVK